MNLLICVTNEMFSLVIFSKLVVASTNKLHIYCNIDLLERKMVTVFFLLEQHNTTVKNLIPALVINRYRFDIIMRSTDAANKGVAHKQNLS